MKAVTGTTSPVCKSPTRLILDQAMSNAQRDARAPPKEWPAGTCGNGAACLLPIYHQGLRVV